MYLQSIEHQSPDLNTLSRLLLFRPWNRKRRVRHPARPPIRLGLEALEDGHHLRRLVASVVEPDRRVRLDEARFANLVRIDHLDGEEVGVGDGPRVRHGQRVSTDGAQGPPDIDDLVPALQERVRFGREVLLDSLPGREVGLVDVHALDRPAG